MKNHSGFISQFNAWRLNKSRSKGNEQIEEHRKELCSGLSGRILEIGPGTGSNLEHYSNKVSLTGLEPNPHMQKYLNKKARQTGTSIEIITGTSEEIPAADESFDAVVSTLVLCSVESLEKSLSEIKRVLKPGGQFSFIEHVAAPKNTWLRTAQSFIKPLWKWKTDGCHPDRETWKSIENTGFDYVEIEHFRLSLFLVAPHIMGKAFKAKKSS